MSDAAQAPLTYEAPTDKPVSRKLITGACMAVMVLASMEVTITSTVMPTIIGSLHGLEHYAWVVSIYILGSTLTMPFYGRLADLAGRKKVLISAIVIFLIGSAGASFSTSMLQLILWRGLQGLGAGGIMPTVLTVLGDIYTLKERAKIQGAFSAIWGGAALAGPALGYLLVTTLGWRSVFYVPLPLGIAAIGVLVWAYRDTHKSEPGRTMDAPGLLLLSLAALLMLTGVSIPLNWSWTPWLLLAGVLASWAFVYREKHFHDPLVPLDVLRSRAVGPPLIASACLGAGLVGLDTFVPLFVQLSPTGTVGNSAAVVTPVMLAWATSGIVAAPLMVRIGFRKTAVFGSVLVLIGFGLTLLCAAVEAPLPVLSGVLLLTGFGFGPSSMSCLMSAQNAVDYRTRGTITSTVTLTRSLGSAIGVGLLGAVFALLAAKSLASLGQTGVNPATLLDPELRKTIDPALLRPAAGALRHDMLWIIGALSAIGVIQLIASLRFPRHRPANHPAETTAADAASPSPVQPIAASNG